MCGLDLGPHISFGSFSMCTCAVPSSLFDHDLKVHCIVVVVFKVACVVISCGSKGV